jgi:methanogenic corrinoid protein MtbC1
MASKPMVVGEPLAVMTDSGTRTVAAFSGGMSVGEDLGFDLDGMPAPAVRTSDHCSSEHRRVALLARALESEVIPRLVLARRSAGQPTYRDAGNAAPTAADIESLTQHVMQGDLAGATAQVSGLRARAMPLERIYLEVLAPVARHLGDLWMSDRCDFTAVTVGLCCLQQLVLENSHAFGPRPGRRDSERRILLAPTPGEQHSFGLLMVGEFFRRQGWDVCSGTGASARELVATTRKQWFSMVGFSMASDGRIDALAALIRDIRRNSRNPNIGVLVGGHAFAEQPELTALVGADATATDGQQAVLKAETLLALLVQES